MARATLCCCLGFLVAPTVGGDFIPVGVFSDIAGHPTARAPGLGVDFTSFGQPYRSANGVRWIMPARVQRPSTEDQVILVGTAFDPQDAVVVVEEGRPTGWDPLVNNGTIDSVMGINDGGDFVYETSTDLPIQTNEIVARFNVLTQDWTVIARERDPIPGVAGSRYSAEFGGPFILTDGAVGLRAPSPGGVIPAGGALALVGDETAMAVVAQTGTTPTGAPGPWEQFDSRSFRMDAAGNNYILRGDTAAPTTEDDIVVVNGRVVLQEGAPIPDSGLSDRVFVSSLIPIYLSPNGDWMARGGFDTPNRSWLLLNGNVIALSGEPVPGGKSGETFRDAANGSTFGLTTTNGRGHFVYHGRTRNGALLGAFLDEVLVFNDERVIARAGVAVDLDGNGVLDDDVFISRFRSNAILTDDATLFFGAFLADGNQNDVGEGFLMLDLSALVDPCLPCGDANCDGTVSVGDINFFVAAVTRGEADWNALFPGGVAPCDYNCANDTNRDRNVSVGDVNAFIRAVALGDCS